MFSGQGAQFQEWVRSYDSSQIARVFSKGSDILGFDIQKII